MSDSALALAIFDTIWEVTRFIAEITRVWLWLRRNEDRSEMARQIGFDPRIWWMWLGQSALQKRRAKWNWTWIPRLALCHKILTTLYVVWTTESTIFVNGLSSVEAEWSFGQKFAIVNTLALFAVVCFHYRRRFHYVGCSTA